MKTNSNVKNAMQALLAIVIILTVCIAPTLLFTSTTAKASENFTDDVSCSNQHAQVDFGTASQGYITIDVTMDVTKKSRAVLSANGNETTFELPATHSSVLPLTAGSGKYDVTIYNQDDNDEYQNVLSTSFSADIENDQVPYLQANAFVYYEYGDDVQFIAEELSAELTTVEEKTAAFQDYVMNNIAVNTEITSDSPAIDAVMKSMEGSDLDRVAVFTAMCRTQNIPCRMHIGEFNNTARAWAEVYENGDWTRYDFTLAGTLDHEQEVIQNDNNYNTVNVF